MDFYDEKLLLAAAKKGDLAAFEKILYHYEKMIFNYVFRFTGQKQDAEDLTQAVFIKFYKSLKIVEPEKNFKAWLYKIAANTVYDWLRVKKRNQEISVDNFDKIEGAETFGQDESYLIDREESLAIEAALDKLRLVYKNILLLYYRDEFSYKEIAEILSWPINTVKTALYRAKRELKQIILDERNTQRKN